MARYCFYCGRELATGEKCSCRSRTADSTSPDSSGQTRSTAGHSQQPSGPSQRNSSQHRQQQQAKSTGPKASRKGSSFWSRFQTSPSKKPPFGGFTRQNRMDTTALLAGVSQYLRYLTRPVDSIRQAVQYLNPSRLILLMLIHALIGGLTVIRINQLGTLDLLMQLTRIQESPFSFLSSLFLFIQGAGVTLVFDWLLILITHLTLHFVFRSPFAFTRVAASFVPLIFYQALFSLLALLSLTLVPVTSLLTLGAGLAMTLLVLYLVIRQLTGFDENRCFVLVTFVVVVFTSIVSLVLNLTMPMLTLLLEQSLPL